MRKPGEELKERSDQLTKGKWSKERRDLWLSEVLAAPTLSSGDALVRRLTVRSPGGPGQSSWDGFELTDEGRRMLQKLEAEGEAAELWLKVRRRAVGT